MSFQFQPQAHIIQMAVLGDVSQNIERLGHLLAVVEFDIPRGILLAARHPAVFAAIKRKIAHEATRPILLENSNPS
jgi:hypothetical protein